MSLKNNFLNELQEDILSGRGYYLLFIFTFIVVFTISITGMEIVIGIFRIILSTVAFIYLTLIYVKCKNIRDSKQDKIIIINTFLFFILTCVCMYDFIKLFN